MAVGRSGARPADLHDPRVPSTRPGPPPSLPVGSHAPGRSRHGCRSPGKRSAPGGLFRGTIPEAAFSPIRAARLRCSWLFSGRLPATVEGRMRCLLSASRGGSGLAEAGAGDIEGAAGVASPRPARSRPEAAIRGPGERSGPGATQPGHCAAVQPDAAAPTADAASGLVRYEGRHAPLRPGTWGTTGIASRRPAMAQPLDLPLNPAACGSAGSRRSSSPR